ncbi:MAG: hypothetical protein Tsb0034_20030 [Ekhidna sp.]
MRKLNTIIYICYICFIFVCSCSDNGISGKEDSFFLKSEPEEVGFDTGFLEELNKQAKALPNIYSFLVIKDGALVHEAYFNGAKPETLLHVRSITKSISSIAIGIALCEGVVSSLDEKIVKHYSAYIEEGRTDGIRDVTLGHILDMKTGVDWNEGQEAIAWYTSIQDTWEHFFQKQVIHDPGTIFNYNSGAVSLLNRFVENDQPLSYQDYVHEKLLKPLDITDFAWEKDGLGNTRADAGLQLRAVDLAKIGYIMMQDGKKDDLQVIPKEWIDASWKFEINLNADYGPIENLHYNKLWWMGEYDEHQVFFGLGYGGQLMLCVPDYDLIVITNHEFRLPGNVVASHSNDFLEEVFKPILDHLIANN